MDNRDFSEKYYKCYSGKLKKYLLDNNIKYCLKAIDYNSHNTFWLFEQNKELGLLLKKWSTEQPTLIK